jgi:hypothetical protein
MFRWRSFKNSKKNLSRVLEIQKLYGLDKIIDLKTAKFVVSKHPCVFETKVFCKIAVFIQNFKKICIQTKLY